MSVIAYRKVNRCEAVQWTVGGLIAFSGVLSEAIDAWGRSPSGGRSNHHVMFGVMLCLGVIVRFRYGLWPRERSGLADIGAFARQLTRTIYVLLYGLLFFNVLLGCAGEHKSSPASFQPYLAWGVAAILLTRALAGISHGNWHTRAARGDLIDGTGVHPSLNV